jgi:hypothetical protein
MTTSGYIGQTMKVKIKMADALVEGADHTVRFTGPQANPGDASIGPATMTFTHENWSEEQELSVTPWRGGTIPINYEITSPYTSRKKTSSFNVFAENLPQDVPVVSGSGYHLVHLSNFYGNGLTITVNSSTDQNVFSLTLSGTGNGQPGFMTVQWTKPDGSIHLRQSIGDSLVPGVHVFKVGCNATISAPYQDFTETMVPGPHQKDVVARIERSWPNVYDTGWIVCDTPDRIHYFFEAGNYTNSGGYAPGHDAGPGITSDSWSIPFYLSSGGNDEWEITVNSLELTLYPTNSGPVKDKVSITSGNLDVEGDASVSVSISDPGNTPHTWAATFNFSLSYAGVQIGTGMNFSLYPWTIHTN